LILAAHQTHYAPYPGLLDKIDQSDVFVFQDDLKYIKQEWQNRNKIRTPKGWMWLTIPVRASDAHRIQEVYPADPRWVGRHQRVVDNFYHRSPYLGRLSDFWRAAQVWQGHSLATINYRTTLELARLLGIENKEILLESELHLTKEQCRTANARLISLCKILRCDTYLSGLGAKAYLDLAEWERAGIEVRWREFELQEYQQMYPGWVPNLSVLDLLLCVEDPLSHIRRSRRRVPRLIETEMVGRPRA